MRKRKIKTLISRCFVSLLLIITFTACEATDKSKVTNYFEIEEQKDMLIQDTDKIYPNDKLTLDKTVTNSNISDYMEKYNASATEESSINYDAIRYDETEKIHYVYDESKNSGIKFITGDYGQILSAKVFTGNTGNSGPNLVDMATVALNTFGYSGMSEEDKKNLESITSKKDSIKNEIQSNLYLFDGNLNLSVSLKESVNLIDIPAPNHYASDENKENSSEQMGGLLDDLKSEAQQNVTNKEENNQIVTTVLGEAPELSVPETSVITTTVKNDENSITEGSATEFDEEEDIE